MNDSDIAMMKELAKKDYHKSTWWKRTNGRIRMVHILKSNGYTYKRSEELTVEYIEHMRKKAKDQKQKRLDLQSEINPPVK
jgi:cystathionine beta-lyase family protein involved in aluminum resistance